MPSVINEYQQFEDEDTGELIVNGYIYIGTQNLDAKLNLITIYPDRALSGTPLANPQRTGSDGRALNKIWIPGKYSMKVEDSNNVQKLNDLDRGEDPQTGNTKLINVLGVNDLVSDASPTITTLIDSQAYIFSAPAAPTGAMTLKIDSTAIKDIKKGDGLAIEANDFAESQKIVVVYNEPDDWFEVTSGVLSPDFSGNVTIGGTLDVVGEITSSNVGASNVKLNTKVIDIGDWDMDTNSNISVTHGLTSTKIRSMVVTIRNDTDSQYHDFSSQQHSALTAGQFVRASSTSIAIERQGGGTFDDTSFSSTSFNRGWITVQYTD